MSCKPFLKWAIGFEWIMQEPLERTDPDVSAPRYRGRDGWRDLRLPDKSQFRAAAERPT